MRYLSILSCLLFAFPLSSYAQVVIGKDTKAPPKKYTLLELRADLTKDTAQGFMLPQAKTQQRDSITAGSNRAKFPKGGVVYNVTTSTLDVYTKKADKSGDEWRSLSYGRQDTVPELVFIDTNSVKMSGTTITIPAPQGYALYQITDTPVVAVACYGLTLTPKVDFDAKKKDMDSVEITFKTLIPEKKSDFGKIWVQYVPR